jgi:hypothetical protein
MALSHWVWAGLGALAIWPLKHIWENWIEKFWTAFWISFKTGFKQTPGGAEFLKSYHDARAAQDQKVAAEHPELADMLHCKKCSGKGCDDCGGTGWV